ncbi:MAG: histidine phosphatase family protein [Chlamydiales bacterium]|nr:histidine phosphatase family protein [Chlamydiales bacterium]
MSILVLLTRHAKPLAQDISQRLSESGKEMQKVVNSHLKNDLQIEPSAIWTSPILRAKETAMLIGEEFALEPQEEMALSDVAFDELEITEKLAHLPDESTIIMVSHAPQLMRLATYWMGSQAYGQTPPTSSVLLIELDYPVIAGNAKIVRFITYSDLGIGK